MSKSEFQNPIKASLFLQHLAKLAGTKPTLACFFGLTHYYLETHPYSGRK